MATTYDRIVINPTLDQVEAMLIEAAGLADEGARSRTVGEGSLVASLRESWAKNEADAQWTDGGGVPNSYRQRAETSVLGFAFFISPTGERHVRVCSGRWDAPKSSFGRTGTHKFGLSATLHDRAQVEALVYPALQVALATRKKDKGLVPELLRAIEATPLDLASVSALVDTLAENGDYRRDGLTVTMAQARAMLEVVRLVLDPIAAA